MSTKKSTYFFSASQSVDDQLGKTFSFIWANYVSLRELWWQVRGFTTNFPDLHISVIEKKFFSGLPKPGGIDLKHLCIDNDWNKHEQEFSKWLLFDACTLYEGWAEKVCSQVFNIKDAEKYAKQIQFPNGTKSGKQSGYILAILKANENISTFIKTEFFPFLSKGKYNSWVTIDEYLIGYRYFKECRNSFIHSDGKVTAEIITAHTNLSNVLAKNPTLFRHNFSLPLPTLDSNINLNTNDVILFTRLIKSLISTFDAALCVSTSCESILEQRLKKIAQSNLKWQNLPADKIKREQRIHRMLTASKIPEPNNINNVDSWMVSKKIIR